MELECYTVIWAVKKFYYYLNRKKFKVITDHHYMLKQLKENLLKKQRVRWILKLQPYDMEIIYKEEKRQMLYQGSRRKKNNGKT